MSEDSERWRVLRDIITRRSRGRCEACGSQLSAMWEAHHRRPRGAGGSRRTDTHAPPNLLALHPGGHLWAETNRDAARARGLLVPQGVRPETVPLVLPSGRRVLLDESGFYLPAPGAPYDLDAPVVDPARCAL